MSIYGEDSRQSVGGAPPAVLSTTLKSTSSAAPQQKQQQKSGEGLLVATKSLGNAFEQFLTTQHGNVIAQKKMDAAARQGQDSAINSIDAESKRTGWERGIYGQDEGYEVAQQRAAGNAIQAAYIEEAVKIDDYASMTPEEFKQQNSRKLDGMLKQYEGDKVTQQIVADGWSRAVEKLTGQQHAAHYGYKQIRNREEADKSVRQSLDELNVDMNAAITLEDKADVMLRVNDLVQGKFLPEGMNQIAKREAINTGVMSSLASGNIGAYNAFKAHGWVETLNPKETAQLHSALNTYDQDYSYKFATAFEEAELASLSEDISLEDAKATWFKLDTELKALSVRNSGTQESKKILATYLSASAGKRSQLDDMAKRLLKKGALADAKAERGFRLRDAMRSDSITSVQKFVELNLEEPITKSERTAAMDANILEDVKRLTGSDDVLTIPETVGALLGNPALAKTIGTSVSRQDATSGIIQIAANQLINGFANGSDDANLAAPEVVTAIESMKALAVNKETFLNHVDKDQQIKLKMIQDGVEQRLPVTRIQENIDGFFENRGKESSLVWPTEKQGVSDKLQYVKDIVSDAGGGIPEGSSLAEYMETFKTGLVIHNGDFAAAKDYTVGFVKANGINYKGKKVVGGKRLNDLTGEIQFTDMMDFLQSSKSPSGNTWLGDQLTRILPDTDKGRPPQTLDEVAGWRLRVEEGIDGVYLHSTFGTKPLLLTSGMFKNWQTEAKIWKDDNKRVQDAKNKAAKTYIEMMNASQASY